MSEHAPSSVSEGLSDRLLWSIRQEMKKHFPIGDPGEASVPMSVYFEQDDLQAFAERVASLAVSLQWLPISTAPPTEHVLVRFPSRLVAIAYLRQRDELLAALKGVVRVADRKTVEFDAARAAIAKAEGRS